MLFIVHLNTLFCLQISIHLAWAQRQGQVVPRDRQSHRHADVRRGRHTLPIKYIQFHFFLFLVMQIPLFPQTSLTFGLFKLKQTNQNRNILCDSTTDCAACVEQNSQVTAR